MANKESCWQAAATYDETGEHATFAPDKEMDMWQVRVRNNHASLEATPTAFAIDEDGLETEIGLSPSVVGAEAGVEYTIETKNPKLKIKIIEAAGGAVSSVVKVKAWLKYSWVGTGRPYIHATTAAATTGGVTVSSEVVIDSTTDASAF